MEKFGLQKIDAKPEDNICPQNQQDVKKTKLDLDDDCNLVNMEERNAAFYRKITAYFEDEKGTCVGKNRCKLSISKASWPSKCQTIIDSDNAQVLAFAIVTCSNEKIFFSEDDKSKFITRVDLGMIIVGVDTIVMMSFVGALIYWQAQVANDSERHRNLLFETSGFSIQVSNLPKLNDSYTAEMLKADLWTHFEESIKGESQVIERLASTSEEQNCQIVDIQFAMSDYQYLEDIVAIKNYTNQIAMCEAEI